jgi:hypothetical protein
LPGHDVNILLSLSVHFVWRKFGNIEVIISILILEMDQLVPSSQPGWSLGKPHSLGTMYNWGRNGRKLRQS